MRTIWKFQLRLEDVQAIEIPADSKIIHVGLDPNGELCFWAEVNPHNPKHKLEFFVIGTGNSVPHEATKHHGSVVMGPFVWHVYQGEAATPRKSGE